MRYAIIIEPQVNSSVMFRLLIIAKRLITISMICGAALSTTLGKHPQSEVNRVLRICNRLYGPAVDNKRHLFAVNEFYVMRLKFNSRGLLVQLHVSPKYFFAEARPEWAEPDNFEYLSKSQYDTVVTQIDAIKSRGARIKGSEKIPVVTNMTAPHHEIYRRATFAWGELIDLRRGDNAPLRVRWIEVHYHRALNPVVAQQTKG